MIKLLLESICLSTYGKFIMASIFEKPNAQNLINFHIQLDFEKKLVRTMILCISLKKRLYILCF